MEGERETPEDTVMYWITNIRYSDELNRTSVLLCWKRNPQPNCRLKISSEHIIIRRNEMTLVALSAALIIASFSTAQAEPFLIELPFDWARGADQGLRNSLGFVELEKYRVYDTTYMVADARNAAFIETYFRATGVPNARISPIILVHQSMLDSAPERGGGDGMPIVIGWSLGKELAPFLRSLGN